MTIVRRNNKNLKALKFLRKDLRTSATPAEKRLWFLLRNTLEGIKFRRQYSIGNYILDFYSIDLKLAIELDGNHHHAFQMRDKDFERTNFLMENMVSELSDLTIA